MTARLLVVGGGRMGEALVRGALAARWCQPAEVVVVETSPARRQELSGLLDGVAVSPGPEAAEGAVLAVKPADAEAACRDLAGLGTARVLSIAAGVRLARLEQWLGASTAVLRAMPNTPALIGAGVSALAAGAAAGPDDLAWAESVLASVGEVVRLPEHQLDAVTGLSGSGPAYLFLVAEALTEAGVLAGLPRADSTVLAHRTLVGAARLLVETGQSPEALRAAVTSPGGTTAAGLQVLEDRAVRAAFLAAVQAATERSRQLGG